MINPFGSLFDFNWITWSPYASTTLGCSWSTNSPEYCMKMAICSSLLKTCQCTSLSDITGLTIIWIECSFSSNYEAGSNWDPTVAIRSPTSFSYQGILWMLKASKLSMKSQTRWQYECMWTYSATDILQTLWTTSFESPNTLSCVTPRRSAKIIPWIKSLYSASLLEQINWKWKDLRVYSSEGVVRQMPASDPVLDLTPSKL